MAEMIGAARPRVAAALSELRALGLVEVDRKRIVVPDLERISRTGRAPS
jgi:hypothetical protein